MSFKAKSKQKLLVIFKILAILGQARLQGSSRGQALGPPYPFSPSSQISQGQDSKRGFVPITLPDRAGKSPMNQAGHPGWEYRAGSRFKEPCGPMKPFLHPKERHPIYNSMI